MSTSTAAMTKPSRIRVSSFRLVIDLMIFMMMIFFIGYTSRPLLDTPNVHNLGTAVLYMLGLGGGLLGGIWMIVFVARNVKQSERDKYPKAMALLFLALVLIGAGRLIWNFAMPGTGGYNQQTLEAAISVAFVPLLFLVMMFDIFRPSIHGFFTASLRDTSKPRIKRADKKATSASHQEAPMHEHDYDTGTLDGLLGER